MGNTGGYDREVGWEGYGMDGRMRRMVGRYTRWLMTWRKGRGLAAGWWEGGWQREGKTPPPQSKIWIRRRRRCTDSWLGFVVGGSYPLPQHHLNRDPTLRILSMRDKTGLAVIVVVVAELSTKQNSKNESIRGASSFGWAGMTALPLRLRLRGRGFLGLDQLIVGSWHSRMSISLFGIRIQRTAWRENASLRRSSATLAFEPSCSLQHRPFSNCSQSVGPRHDARCGQLRRCLRLSLQKECQEFLACESPATHTHSRGEAVNTSGALCSPDRSRHCHLDELEKRLPTSSHGEVANTWPSRRAANSMYALPALYLIRRRRIPALTANRATKWLQWQAIFCIDLCRVVLLLQRCPNKIRHIDPRIRRPNRRTHTKISGPRRDFFFLFLSWPS